jgi:hypothetical protein
MTALPSVGSWRPTRRRAVSRIALAGAATLVAAVFGTLLPSYPLDAVALVAVVPLAVLAPGATLVVVLFVTVLVPFDIQNELSIGGGVGKPGLFVVDVLIALGVLRIAFMIVTGRMRLTAPIALAGALAVGFIAAMLHGLLAGAGPSDAGDEARCLLLGAGTFLIAWPLLQEPIARARLGRAMLVLGLALGVWGLFQWVFGVAYSSAGDVGVRPGIDQIASAGGGQLQGGLFAYPVAVILSYAALLSHSARRAEVRVLLAASLALNAICVLVTYERSIWGATAIGCAFVTVALRRSSRPNAIGWLSFIVAVLLAFSALGSGSIGTAGGRLGSILTLRSDNAVVSREVESRAVLGRIRQQPVVGSGLGTTVTWGERDVFATTTASYTHNGYLWLAWKLGIPFAVAVVALIGAAAFRRGSPHQDPVSLVARVGSRASLIALLTVGVAFPVFNSLGITAAIGLLAAVCATKVTPRGPSDA